jgi:MFS family permease
VLGYSPLKAGFAFLPMTLTIVAGSMIASRLVTRIGVKPLLIGGMLSLSVGLLLFSRVPADGAYLSDILPAALLTAAGLGAAFVPVTIAAVAGVGPSEAGLASGLVNTSRQVGGALGLAILATVATAHTTALAGGGKPSGADLTAGFDRAFEVGAGFALAGVLVAVFALQLRRREEAAVEAVAPEAA